MEGPTFPMLVGERFTDLTTMETIEFADMHPLDAKTVVFLYRGFAITMHADVFVEYYIRGRFQEVPGAGNIREVVQEGLD